MLHEEQRHLQVTAALALLENEAQALELAESLSEERASLYRGFCKAMDPSQAGVVLKAFKAQEDFSGIAEIHPAWLLDILKNESPRVIGVVLRHLPSRHVRYLLENLPRRLTMELPKLIEAFYVPGELLDVIRRRVERRFVPMRVTHEVERFGIEHLYFLKIEDLNCLGLDLGLSELALSLVGSGRKILQIVLNRFNLSEAKILLGRVQAYRAKPRWLIKDARYSVLELGQKEMGARRFLEELGRMALAKAFSTLDRPVQALCQKMEPEKAYTFKRYLGAAGKQQTALRAEWILEHLERLSREQKTDPLYHEAIQKTLEALRQRPDAVEGKEAA